MQVGVGFVLGVPCHRNPVRLRARHVAEPEFVLFALTSWRCQIAPKRRFAPLFINLRRLHGSIPKDPSLRAGIVASSPIMINVLARWAGRLDPRKSLRLGQVLHRQEPGLQVF